VPPPALSQAQIEVLAEVSARRRVWRILRAKLQRQHALDFNVFDFLRRDELGLSEIIRWMLDPDASHGQGAEFLRAFIESHQIDGRFAIDCAISEVEVATHSIEASQRRIDVHVSCGAFILAIENKPYAAWQSEQARDYLRHLQNVAPDNHCLVLLKREKGRVPKEQLTAAEVEAYVEAGRLVDSDYEELAAWVRECERRCDALRVRTMLGEFATFIERDFGKGSEMAEHKFVVEAIMSDPARVAAALELYAAADELLSEIVAAFVASLREAAEKRDWSVADTIEGPAELSSTANAVTIDFGDPRLVFAFVVDSGDGTVYFGLITRKANKNDTFPAWMTTALGRALGGSGKPGWRWPWWRYLQRGDIDEVVPDDFESIWSGMHRRSEMVRLIISQVELAQKALMKAS
jgi:PD-(D/E)XK nuclease superfamily